MKPSLLFILVTCAFLPALHAETTPPADVALSRTLDAGMRFHRTFTQTIPGSASAGAYAVVGNAGTLPTPETSDQFSFDKL